MRQPATQALTRSYGLDAYTSGTCFACRSACSVEMGMVAFALAFGPMPDWRVRTA